MKIDDVQTLKRENTRLRARLRESQDALGDAEDTFNWIMEQLRRANEVKLVTRLWVEAELSARTSGALFMTEHAH